MITALLSSDDPIRKDSETNIFLFFAIDIASWIFSAYCKISRATNDTGVADAEGISDFAALMVTVSPFSFIPETTPINPPQVIDINLYPSAGSASDTILFS